MNRRRILKYFMMSIPLSAIYYLLLANFIFIGDDAALRRENRDRAKQMDSAEIKVSLLDGAVRQLQARDASIYSSIFGSVPSEDLYHRETGEHIDLTHALEMASDVKKSMEEINMSLSYLGTSSDNIPSIIPVRHCGLASMGASLGRKVNPFTKSVVWHNGIDIICQSGSQVVSPAEGVVSSVFSDRIEGLVVEIDHLNGYKTRYSHLEEVLVKKGDTLRRAETFATSGNSGRSMAPHLHYEVMLDGKRANPVFFFFASFSPKEYSRILHKAENAGQSLD